MRAGGRELAATHRIVNLGGGTAPPARLSGNEPTSGAVPIGRICPQVGQNSGPSSWVGQKV